MSLSSGPEAEALASHTWDAIVVGTGIGGATLGYALAKAGKRVLFCEAGRSTLAGDAALAGVYPELHGGRVGKVLNRDDREVLAKAGRYINEVVDQGARRATRFVPFVGAGTGGSSALYGMALERFLPSDFVPRAHHPHAGDSTLGEAWPISYQTLAPYYAAAEKLFRVRGSDDPLRTPRGARDALLPPPPLTPGAADLFDFLQTKRLNPYRLPMACEFVPGCEGCQGFLCARECKNDSVRMCLRPALTQFGASLIDECEVLGLDADRERVRGVVCSHRGQEVTFRADTVILAAGAFQTPNILLRSRSSDWPQGVANESGLVGRNLMRHFIDLYLIEPSQRAMPGFDNRFKELALNDFYVHDGMKLGSVQSFGRLPLPAMLFESLRQDLRDTGLPPVASLLAAARPFMTPVLHKLVHGATALVTTMEDLPYRENCVTPADSASARRSDLTIKYSIKPEARDRIRRFRTLMDETLSARRWRRVKQAENNQRIAHVCGTCRFGLNSSSSVLNEDNRAHGLRNLYVVDSSFFPSSGGTNPSLTIAANALRVADQMLARN